MIRRGARVSAVVGVVFALVLILLPQFVVAETQEEITTIVSIDPYNSSADEVVNVANATSRWNIDTWPYLPSGVFVGGTIPESCLRLNEMYTAPGYLLMSSVIQFQDSFVGSGASMFTVRLPWSVTDEYVNTTCPLGVQLWILRLEDPTDWSINWTYDTYYYRPEPTTTSGVRLAWIYDIASYWEWYTGYGGTPNNNPVNDSWTADGRLYVRTYAPLISEEYYYLFLTVVPVLAGAFADVYLHPSDLSSDEILSSSITTWWPALGGAHNQRSDLEADLGYSFVFQKSVGDMAAYYDNYYTSGQQLQMTKWVRSPGRWLNGSFNFVFEFGSDSDDPLEVSIQITHGTDVCIDAGYWTDMSFNQTIIASNPTWASLEGVLHDDGDYWHEFTVLLTFTNDTRMQFLMFADPVAPLDGTVQIAHTITSTSAQRIFFSPWLTCSVDAFTINCTAVASPAGEDGSAWILPERDFSLARWFDLLGAVLWDRGQDLMQSDGLESVGAVFGVVLMAAGVISWIAADWLEKGYDFAKSVIRTIIDVILDIGTWLWNVAMKIWDALTWLAEKIVYYGSIILGLLIILVAMFIFIVPVYFEIKILGAFLAMANGDYEKASAQLAGVVSAGKSMIGRG
jgi:hypothetical protein